MSSSSLMTTNDSSNSNNDVSFSTSASCRSTTKTSTPSSPSATTSSTTSAAAQVASLYLQHQQKQFASTSTSVTSTKSEAAVDWSRRSTFTTAVGPSAKQTFSTSAVMSTSTSGAARRFSTSSERDEGLYSMSSVSVDLGESAARHHHTFNKPDPRPLQPPRPASYDRPGKYSTYFDHHRIPTSSNSNDYSGKR